MQTSLCIRHNQLKYCGRTKSCLVRPSTARQESKKECVQSNQGVQAASQVLKNDLKTEMEGFRVQVDLPCGSLSIQPLTSEYVGETATLLTDSFVAAEQLQAYRKFVKRQITRYLMEHKDMPPATLVLVALLQVQQLESVPVPPIPHTEMSNEEVVQRPLLVGAAEVSFDETTRRPYVFLNPPKDCAYLCNMAVLSSYQRRGIARALLAAIDDVAVMAGVKQCYLHNRLIDEPAAALYSTSGFTVVDTDCVLLPLVGQKRRHLMARPVGANKVSTRNYV